MKRFVFAVVLAMAVLAVATTAVLAAERIPVTLTEEGEAHGNPELRAGHLIVNPSGVWLLINGALPDRQYLIVFMVHDTTHTGPDECRGMPLVTFNAARTTDAQGNLNIRLTDSWPEAAPEVLDVRVLLADLVVQGNPTAYSSECVGVAIR